MRLRERTGDDLERNEEPGDGSGDANLASMRLAGQNLLAAGADAINKALSGNSETFLRATRQQGGQ